MAWLYRPNVFGRRPAPSPPDEATRVLPTLPYGAAPWDAGAGRPYGSVPPTDDRDQRTRGRGLPGWLRSLLLLLVLIPLALVGVGLLVTPVRETVLILGSDARPDELQRGAVGRTDTLMLVVADRALPKAGLISVPRDLWVPIPGYGEERVNAAYELGGAQTAKQTVSNLLGVRVDRFLVIGLQGVRDVVDAVGGVDITVEQALYDPAYPTDDYGTVEVTIPAGRQRMDGETALRYARTRHQDSDFGRIGRQQQVLSAVRNALLNPLNWPRVPAVLAAIQRSTRTDVTPFDAVAVAAAFLRAPGDPERLVLDQRLVTPFTGQGGAALLAPNAELPRAVARFLGTTPAAVEVLNASGVAGAARRTADRLAGNGFEITRVGDADRPQAQTVVQVRGEARSAGERVASTLGLAGARVSEVSLPRGIDVRVLVGPDTTR